MEFRDFRKDDYRELISLWNDLGMSGEERGDTPGVILRTLKHGGKLIILENDGEIIGSSWLTVDGRRVFLHHFCIKAGYQGRGYGTMLAEESMKFIRKTGLQVKLEVHKSNKTAKRLYEKMGFFAFTDYDIYMKRDV